MARVANQWQPFPSLPLAHVSFPINLLLSHFPAVHVPSPSAVSPPSLCQSSTHAACGGRPTATNVSLESQPEMSSGGALAGHRSSCLCHHFWLIPEPSDLLSRWNHLFWNERSTAYKTIPLLPVESSSLRSWVPIHTMPSMAFSVNWDSFVR